MRPTVLIIEARREVAKALEAVITSASFTTLVVPHLERLTDLPITPAVIVVRIAFEGVSDPPHTAIERLPVNHPPVVAIVWEDDELKEAQRLKCDVVLHAPQDVSLLCDTLTRLAHT
jgi:hypothetical protein